MNDDKRGLGMPPLRCADRLERARTRPLIISQAVRTALKDAVAWRIGGGAAPSDAAFVAAACAAARLDLDAENATDVERSRTLEAVGRAAARFASTALCRRLMCVPAAHFVRLRTARAGADIVVRDRRRRLHAVLLTARADAFDAGRIASEIARATPLALTDRLSPLTVHVFSLATGQRHVVERDAVRAVADRSRKRVA